MSSIRTNAAAMTALQSLTQTNKALEKTQNHISTGYRVGTAADNAAYWSIATTMRSDNKALSAVKDALGLGAATVDVAYTALEKSIEVVGEIKAKLVAAREPGVDRSAIQAEIDELQNQLKSIAESATFSEENWLSVDSSASGYNGTKTVVASFTRTSTGVKIQTISINIDNIKLYDASGTADGILDDEDTTSNGGVTYSVATLDISSLTDSSADLQDLEQIIGWVDSKLDSMTTAASNLGAAKQRIDLQKDFVSSLMDSITRGVSQLVDADMNAESTRLQALQVQQQLGVQALSIANSTSQTILSLFR
ncbi:flagellin [Thermopetrobacter sp. TC1]|uniref:flagellin N-terminal helical domain-containing protein n=1 Tax=Thermopetrobacter sp. TC1 TaxID=1495045 RepID=UPI00056FDCC4|nr:flagellin [Thermopetrobacter sp. TC1]